LKKIPAFAGMTIFLLSGIAFAQSGGGADIFAHGNENGAMPCAACHGVRAQGNASIGAPKLAGLPAASVKDDLARFAKGEGGNATMQYIAQALSPAETDALAQYISSLK